MILPIAAVRQQLARALPLWKWRCGDNDSGGPQDEADLARPQTIMGKAEGSMVMMAIEARDAPLPPESGAPPHQLHLHLSPPSTDDPEVARRLAVAVCAALASQDAGAHCQIAPGGRWYSAEQIAEEVASCTTAGPSGVVAEGGWPTSRRSQPDRTPPMAVDPMPQTFPRRAEAGGFGRKGL